VTLSATYGGSTKTTTFTVNPAAVSAVLASLTLNSTRVKLGSSVTATVRLSAPAPVGGATVILASSNPAVASVPASVVVAAGTTSKTFAVSTAAKGQTGTVTISASYLGTTKTAALSVRRM
jgi:hypothetical protein